MLRVLQQAARLETVQLGSSLLWRGRLVELPEGVRVAGDIAVGQVVHVDRVTDARGWLEEAEVAEFTGADLRAIAVLIAESVWSAVDEVDA